MSRTPRMWFTQEERDERRKAILRAALDNASMTFEEIKAEVLRIASLDDAALDKEASGGRS